MSTAASESFQFATPEHDTPQALMPRHLQAVPDRALEIDSVQYVSPTDVRQRNLLAVPINNPQEAFIPPNSVQVTHSNVVSFRHPGAQNDPDYAVQHNAIKRMTRAVGAAFVESELGIRPFTQLGSWLELGLFHKLRTRVEYSATNNYLAARRGDESSRKVPSITPIGVRAALTVNGDWESSMTIRVGDRARALAMRLQRHRDRWRVIAFEVG